MATNNETSITLLDAKRYNDATAKTWFSFAVDGLEAMKGTYDKDARDDQQFLEVGCGPRRITRYCLLPRCLPCRRIVAVDVSRDMVEYAQTHYAHPTISYDILDIVTDDVVDFVKMYGRFDRVYSFNCFNWVENQEKAFKNLAELMEQGAECLLWFFAASPHIRFRQNLIKMARWKKYAEICRNYIPPTIDMNGPDEILPYILNLLKSANLTPSLCEVTRESPIKYPSPKTITQELMTMNPLTTLLTGAEKLKLLEDANKEAIKLWTMQETYETPIEFDVVRLCAFKPQQ
ncbi:juvenile hormone acid O-methyltransferase-like [Ixodes scapularis]|uniref:juvenile hormone acid O-methyltransferase-like n=1 Tax=Ixodes scapularis TaxID=6945 RepID=UPI001A9F1F97|nr:juvenile hormone acid O-methyltransferase-like [Ixodes scapularis]